MLQEFRAFVARGNVLDLAIAVIIGGAFGAIVSSMVNDVLMPPLGLALGNVDFKDLFIALDGQTFPSLAAAKTAGAPVIAYGQFINTVINFLILAFVQPVSGGMNLPYLGDQYRRGLDLDDLIELGLGHAPVGRHAIDLGAHRSAGPLCL